MAKKDKKTGLTVTDKPAPAGYIMKLLPDGRIAYYKPRNRHVLNPRINTSETIDLRGQRMSYKPGDNYDISTYVNNWRNDADGDVYLYDGRLDNLPRTKSNISGLSFLDANGRFGNLDKTDLFGKSYKYKLPDGTSFIVPSTVPSNIGSQIYNTFKKHDDFVKTLSPEEQKEFINRNNRYMYLNNSNSTWDNIKSGLMSVGDHPIGWLWGANDSNYYKNMYSARDYAMQMYKDKLKNSPFKFYDNNGNLMSFDANGNLVANNIQQPQQVNNQVQQEVNTTPAVNTTPLPQAPVNTNIPTAPVTPRVNMNTNSAVNSKATVSTPKAPEFIPNPKLQELAKQGIDRNPSQSYLNINPTVNPRTYVIKTLQEKGGLPLLNNNINNNKSLPDGEPRVGFKNLVANIQKYLPGAGDVLSLYGTYNAMTNPLKNVYANRDSDTPNVNPYKNFGQGQMQEISRMQGMNALADSEQRNQLLRANNINSQNMRNNSLSQGNANALAQNSYANTLSAMNTAQVNSNQRDMGISQMKMNLQNTIDQMTMQGEAQRDLADRQDKDAFYSNLSQANATYAKGLQHLGGMFNQQKLNEVTMNLINQLSQYGFALDPNTGKMYKKEQ